MIGDVLSNGEKVEGFARKTTTGYEFCFFSRRLPTDTKEGETSSVIRVIPRRSRGCLNGGADPPGDKHTVRNSEGRTIMGKLRKTWQDFKKSYPDFEKSKDLKADFGPALDKYEDALAKVSACFAKLEDLASEFDKASQNLVVAAAGYKVVVKKLAEKTPQIQKDFDKDFRYVTELDGVKALAVAAKLIQDDLEERPD